MPERMRGLLTVLGTLASFVLAGCGQFVIPGVPAVAVTGLAVLANCLSILFAPFIPAQFTKGDCLWLFLAVCVNAVAFGALVFGAWWWIYLASAALAYVLSCGIVMK